ncbi:MAG: hypothetical protein IKO84_12150 [Butyrivibrio sp.]|nr:hypothetical protein [Butyrivibrio sp.]
MKKEYNENPFTHTPCRFGDANISTTIEEKVYENFRYPQPSECVCKITGIRGSSNLSLESIFRNIVDLLHIA